MKPLGLQGSANLDEKARLARVKVFLFISSSRNPDFEAYLSRGEREGALVEI